MSSGDDISDKLKQKLKIQVFKDLDLIDGKKIVVWQNDVLRRIDLMISASEFLEHNVTRHILLPIKFEKGSVLNLEGATSVIFVIPPQKESFLVLKEILSAKKTGIFYHVRVVCRVSKQLSDMLLGNKDLERKVKSFEIWPFFWSPSFGDLVLNTFSLNPIKIFVDDDFELISLCSSGISDLGIIPQIRYKGKSAEKIVNNVKGNTGKGENLFDELVVIDRETDPLTPFMNQYSFSGILDDLFGIDVKNNIKVPKEMMERKVFLENAKYADEGVDIKLSTDVYRELIHLSVRDALAKIRNIFKELSVIENAHSQLSSVNDFKKYMPALQKLSQRKDKASVALHLLTICYCRNAQFGQKTLYEFERSVLYGEVSSGTASPMIEMLLLNGSEEKDTMQALSLIVVQSLVNGGLQPKVWAEYQRLITQSFGIEAVKWCLNLEHTGVINDVNDKSSRFSWLSSELKKLRVAIDPEQDIKADHYSGYVPLMLEQNSPIYNGLSIRRALFVVGGLTRSELGCLRSLGFTAIFTTNILQSDDLIQLCKLKE
ncbi:unnamed protein product [Bursaphelenchus xylophilus]|uniref:(pine wood nematode) hypothetical protein n=1 Tax=Bursaphelenchus xylophilus TaxID=6326 RepID=A0A7I8WJ34_BURXY|nr:unnamed protein product [Bursaphelenchus xylophilus]CAG9108523.1 unnamed protein product [Bursaphelenchus xylophilus]